MLCYVLGFRYFDIYGFDSCWVKDRHHAYPQKLNDNDRKVNITWGGRKFVCAPWMVKQAQDFMKLIKYRGHLYHCNVRGDGLIAHMIKTGAKASED